jgi:aspartate-semialdehyde dehydrogenase
VGHQGWNVAVVGAAGMVGTEMIKTLEQRRFPVRELRARDVGELAGASLPFAGSTVVCREATEANFAWPDGV